MLGNKATVTKLRATFNLYNGITGFSDSAKITNSVASSNGGYGINSQGPSNTITANSLVSNALDGLIAYGTGDVISNNTAGGNDANGIDDNAFQSTLTSNVANCNGSDGIYVYTFGVKDGGGNTAKGNDTRSARAWRGCPFAR